MTSPDGRPTNAVYGFTRDIFTIRDELKPDYLVFAFDRPGPTFRSTINPDYKAHRPPPPDDLQIQFPMIEQVVGAFNLPLIALDDYEADDVLATLATAGAKEGFEVILCTSDKDCRQLLSDRVRMYNLRKQTFLDVAALRADWGIAPEQVVDFQTLVGDPVDNVAGAPGVGPKTAAKLLQQFGSLDAIIAYADQIASEKIRKAIVDNIDRLAISRRLVTLAKDVPIAIKWEEWRPREWDGTRLLSLFEQFGFLRLSQQVRASTPATELRPKVKPRQSQLFPDEPLTDDIELEATSKPASEWIATYALVDDPKSFADFLANLQQQTKIAFDLETTGLEPLRDEIVGIAVTWQAGHGWYLPLRGPEGSALLPPESTLAALRPILENSAIAKCNQNIKFDLLCFRAAGIDVRGVAGDPMLADYLLRAGERSHNLDDLARVHLHHVNITIDELTGKRGKKQLRMDQVSTDRVSQYAGEDVDVAWRLTEILETELTDNQLKPLYDDLEIPLISVLADMEYHGIRLDVDLLNTMSGEMAEQLSELESGIYSIAGRKFNVSSPIQLRKLLFDELQLPVQRKTSKSGASSTDQESLETLAPLHALPRKIVEHRQIAKLKGTYVDALPSLINPNTGRIHTSFNQTVAATGRLSSSDPNLQNIPARTEMGRQIRQAFLPEPGWRLLTADYSQIELRLLAHSSGDENLKRAFAEGKDIHVAVAARIFGVEQDQVSSEQRRVGKTINFGVIYGMSAHGLAQRLGLDRDVAAKFIEDYFAQYPSVHEYQARLLMACHERGYARTMLGRRRSISGVRPRSSIRGLNQPEREAVNMEIQGSAADMIKLAMLKVHRDLHEKNLKSRMLLTVHDELVLEVPPEEIQSTARLVRDDMMNAMPLSVPIEVDVAIGDNWLDTTEYRDW